MDKVVLCVVCCQPFCEPSVLQGTHRSSHYFTQIQNLLKHYQSVFPKSPGGDDTFVGRKLSLCTNCSEKVSATSDLLSEVNHLELSVLQLQSQIQSELRQLQRLFVDLFAIMTKLQKTVIDSNESKLAESHRKNSRDPDESIQHSNLFRQMLVKATEDLRNHRNYLSEKIISDDLTKQEIDNPSEIENDEASDFYDNSYLEDHLGEDPWSHKTENITEDGNFDQMLARSQVNTSKVSIIDASSVRIRSKKTRVSSNHDTEIGNERNIFQPVRLKSNSECTSVREVKKKKAVSHSKKCGTVKKSVPEGNATHVPNKRKQRSSKKTTRRQSTLLLPNSGQEGKIKKATKGCSKKPTTTSHAIDEDGVNSAGNNKDGDNGHSIEMCMSGEIGPCYPFIDDDFDDEPAVDENYSEDNPKDPDYDYEKETGEGVQIEVEDLSSSEDESGDPPIIGTVFGQQISDESSKLEMHENLENTDFNVDFKGMGPFKRRLIKRIFKRIKDVLKIKETYKDNVNKAPPLPPSLQHLILYNAAEDEFTLRGIKLIHTEYPKSAKQTFACTRCDYIISCSSRGRDKREEDKRLDRNIIRHVSGNHLNLRSPCKICGKPLYKNAPGHAWLHLNEKEKARRLRKGGKDPVMKVKEWRMKAMEKGPFKCSICEKEFRNKNVLGQHRHIHLRKEDRQDYTMCNLCGKILKKAYLKRRHICPQSEESLRKYRLTCLLCDATFKQKNYLDIHMARIHSATASERSYMCEECGKGFRTHNGLRIHSKERPWICGKGCGKDFNVRRYWARHEAVCQGLEKGNAGQAQTSPSSKKLAVF